MLLKRLVLFINVATVFGWCEPRPNSFLIKPAAAHEMPVKKRPAGATPGNIDGAACADQQPSVAMPEAFPKRNDVWNLAMLNNRHVEVVYQVDYRWT